MSPHWEIASPLVRRVIMFDPVDGLYTARFENRATGADLLAMARPARRWTPEFDFSLDGERLTSLGPDWDLAGVANAYPQPDFAAQLVVHLRHRARGLEVYVGFRCDAAGTTKRCWIANTGSRPLTLTRLAIETLPVAIGAPGELLLEAHYGALPRETFITGRVDDCAVVVRNPRTGDCVIAMSEAPGHLKRIETGAWFWEGQVRIMYDTDLFPLELRLAPGAGWGSAAARVLLGDLRQLSDAQVAWYGDQIRWHRALRREVNLAESFFPLGRWWQPSVAAWDGFARLSRAGEGLIVLFRNASTAALARVQIPLPGAARYILTSVLGGVTLGQISAADLRAGVDLAFDADPVLLIAVRLAGNPSSPIRCS